MTVQASFDSYPVVYGYADALVSAVENIVRNAVRHSPADGTVTVILSHDDEGARIEVRDRGKGVDDADLLRLFEPFYRTKDAPYTGTGLGLATAERAVRLNGGRIAADNLTDGGLQVIVTLPADKAS